MRSLLVLVLASAIALTGCSTPASTPTPTAEELGRISTIDELRDAFIDAGGVCNWNQDDNVTLATASGTCSDQTVLMLFADHDDLEATVDNVTAFSADLGGATLLVGDNWIINSAEAEDMQEQLGGEWVTK